MGIKKRMMTKLKRIKGFVIEGNMKKKLRKRYASKTLGILAIVFALLLPAIAYPLAIVGLCIKKDENYYNTDLTLNIIGLSLAVINSILGVVYFLS